MKIKTDMMPWQEQAVEKLLPIRIGALYMDMGTGKTRTALEMIMRRIQANKIDRVIWLCPCSVKGNLAADLNKHAEGWAEIITIEGIESLSSSLRIYDKLSMLAGERTMLVVDESNLVKNHNAIRTERVTKIAEACRYRIILNGTPISKNEKDLYSQWYLLDWRVLGYRSFWSFAANHLEYDPERPGRIKRALNTDYLVRKIAPYSFQISRDECMVLPKKHYSEVGFYLTDEQYHHYLKVADSMIQQLDEMKPSTIYRMFSALQAISSGMKVDVSGSHMISKPFFSDPMDNPRIWKTVDLIRSESEKVIVFCKYQHEIDALESILGEECTVFDGRVSQGKRQKSLESFMGDKRILLCNKQCAGYGLNLQFCHNVIFMSNDWDYATRIQAEDRVHRIGQEKEVSITDVYAYDTLDVKIMRCLSRKEGLVECIKQGIKSSNSIKDDIRAWVKGAVLDGENLPAEKRV